MASGNFLGNGHVLSQPSQRQGQMTLLPNPGKAAWHAHVVKKPEGGCHAEISSESGVRLLRQDKGSGRRAAVTRAVEAAGGKVEAFYFAYGQDDTIIIADYPDAASATAVSLVGNSTGVVRVSMTPLITVEEMDRAVDKATTLPSPGPAR